MSKKCYGFSLGCKVNAYETAHIMAALEENGYSETFDVSESDVIIINTCAVTAIAGQKSRQHIRKFRRLAPNAILIAMGCYTKEIGEEALKMGADIVLGTEGRGAILDAITRFEKEGKPLCLVSKRRTEGPFEELMSNYSVAPVRAYLKIQDGCDKFCSYCAIPGLRGKSRSRLQESILYEIKDLLSKGTKEIVLSGVEIGYYGKDLGEGNYGLGELITDILETFPELERLRISSLDQSEISPSFLEAYRKYKALMPHFHLSLQSGSKSVLERMRRHYDPKDYLKTVSLLREIRKDTAITTDIIAGFPLESEEEWQETLDFAKKAEFAEIHVFPFSARKGTYAATLPDVEPSIKKRRVEELLSLSKELRKSYEKSFYGKELPVLFETYDQKEKAAIGHTENYLLVKVPSDKSLTREIKPVLYNVNNAID